MIVSVQSNAVNKTPERSVLPRAQNTIQEIAELSNLAKIVVQKYPPLAQETRTHVTTEHCAFLLNRQPQTLRVWACYETKGPLRPVRVNGRLAWPLSEIRRVLEINQ